MGFLPDPTDSAASSGGPKFDKMYPPGSTGEKSQARFIELIKLGHGIIKTMVMKAPDDEITAAEDKLSAAVAAMGVTDPVDQLAIGSAILTLAVKISPAVYGEDFNDWKN